MVFKELFIEEENNLNNKENKERAELLIKQLRKKLNMIPSFIKRKIYLADTSDLDLIEKNILEFNLIEDVEKFMNSIHKETSE